MRGDFRQYYLSNFVMPFSCAVIHFSNPIIPFRSLLFIFLNLLCHYEFFYSVSNFIIRFRIMFCSFPLYSPLMQFRILLFPFKFCCSLFQFCYAIMHSFIQFPILLFAFELFMFFQIRDFVYLADGALGTSNKLISRVPAIQKNVADLDVDAVTESITSKHKCNFTVTWFTKFWLW